MKLDKIVSAVLIVPAVVWTISGMRNLVDKGFNSYTFLFPLPVKFHTVSVLNISIFYLVTFLMIRPHRPVKNFSISSSMLFLSGAVYELIYGFFLDWRSLLVTIPLVLGGIIVLLVLNRRFDFLIKDKNRILLFILCFSGFMVVMLTLNYAGFFAEMQLYLGGQATKDPHNPIWILSKTLSVWMFFPILHPAFSGNAGK